MAKDGKDLAEQARNTGKRMRSSAASMMEPAFSSMAPKANARVRTQPGDAQQVNAAAKNEMNGSPSAMPTPYAKGGTVGKKKHADAAQDKALFSKMLKGAQQAPMGAPPPMAGPPAMRKGGKKKFADGGSTNLEADEPAPMQKNKIVPGAAGAGSGAMASRKAQKFAVGGVAKFRHDEATKDGKQKPSKGSGWNAYK